MRAVPKETLIKYADASCRAEEGFNHTWSKEFIKSMQTTKN